MTDAEIGAFIQAELKKERANSFFKNVRDFLLSQSGYTADMLRRIEIDGTPAPIVLDSLGNRVSSEPKLRTEFMTSYSPAPPLTPEKIRAAAALMRVTVGIELQPTDTVLFTVTDGPMLSWPAPPYRSLDAGFRTSTPEWQRSVRERFEMKTGAALVPQLGVAQTAVVDFAKTEEREGVR